MSEDFNSPIIAKRYKPKPKFYRFDVHAGGDNEFLDAKLIVEECSATHPYFITVKTGMNTAAMAISRAKLIAMGNACLELARAK